MTPQQQLQEAILLTAEYYGKPMSEPLLKMFESDLSDLNPLDCVNAYNQWRRNPANRSNPLPAQIRDLVVPALNEADGSRLAAAKIIAAVSKYGWNNPVEARQYIGEVGWEVVQLQGGWQGLCENLRPNMVPALQAQFRELAITVQKEKRVSGDNILRIDTKRGEGGLMSFGEIMKLTPKPEGE